MMSDLVVDSSAVVALLLANGRDVKRLRSLLSDRPIYVPELLDIEVMSVVRRLNRSGELTDQQAEAVLTALAEFPAIRVTHRALLPHAWSLRTNVSAYDASYVALAMRLSATLVTADARLARAVGGEVSVGLICDAST